MNKLINKVEVDYSRRYKDYLSLTDSSTIDKLANEANKLKGYKIVEINSTSHGGGVAELLTTQIPVSKSLGLDIDWYVLNGDNRFYDTTKGLHNCLQGQCSMETILDFNYYQDYLEEAKNSLPEADIYILHDPQTLGLAKYLNHKTKIWRCHIDLNGADPSSFEWLKNHYNLFDKLIFTAKSFTNSLDQSKISLIAPSIDPLSEKNIKLSHSTIKSTLNDLGINENQKYVLQVSRFDKFKDPIGVIEIYKNLLDSIPDLACIFVGNYASDDPEGPSYFNKMKHVSKKVDGEIKFLTEISDNAVNALQTSAWAILQNSYKEGFGLTITEAMWKQKMVFTRSVGGITLQLKDGLNGYILVENNKSNARKILECLSDNENVLKIGKNAHKTVLKSFITPIMLTNYFKTYLEATK